MDPSARLAARFEKIPTIIPVFVDDLGDGRIELSIAGQPVVISLDDVAELSVALSDLDADADPDDLSDRVWELASRFAID